MDETYIKVKGGWKYGRHAVDRHGKIVDFLLTAKRFFGAAREQAAIRTRLQGSARNRRRQRNVVRGPIFFAGRNGSSSLSATVLFQEILPF